MLPFHPCVGPVSEALLKSPAWKGAAGAYGFKNYVSKLDPDGQKSSTA